VRVAEADFGTGVSMTGTDTFSIHFRGQAAEIKRKTQPQVSAEP